MEKRFVWIYITVFVNILGFGMILPLLPLFAETFHASVFEIGLIAATFSLGQFLSAPLWGRLSDRFGRKPILVISIFISVISSLSLAFAESLAIIFASRFLVGVASGAAFPTAQAYIADLTTDRERTEYMGKLSAVFAFGFIFGPVFGGVLGAQGFSLAFLAGAGISCLNLILVLMFLPESIQKKTEKLVLREGFINPRAIYKGLRGDSGALFFLLFLWAFYISNFQVAIPLFTEHRFNMGPLENGLFFSSVGAVASLAQWFLLSIITERIGEYATIVGSLILMVAGQVLYPLSTTVFFLYVFFLTSTFGSALLRPIANAVLSKSTHEGQGTTMGLAFSFESLGRLIGPLIAGLAIGRFGFAAPFWLTAIALFFGLIIFWKVELQKRQ